MFLGEGVVMDNLIHGAPDIYLVLVQQDPISFVEVVLESVSAFHFGRLRLHRL